MVSSKKMEMGISSVLAGDRGFFYAIRQYDSATAPSRNGLGLLLWEQTMGRKNNRIKIRIPRIRESRCIDPRRMDIWFARIPMGENSRVIQGTRPVIIISNDRNNRYSGTVTVIPMTGKLKRLDIPSHVAIGESTALADQVMTIDRDALMKRAGRCDKDEVMQAMRWHLGLNEDASIKEDTWIEGEASEKENT